MMTAEICLMNSRAIALAADSAVTIRSAPGAPTQYTRGANKIIQLSKTEPIAAMINGSDQLNGIPWELLIKEYRSWLDSRCYDTLAEYADEFIRYIEGRTDLYSAADIEWIARDNMQRAMELSAQTIAKNNEVVAARDQKSRSDALQAAKDELLASLSASAAQMPNGGKFVHDYVDREMHSLTPFATSWVQQWGLSGPVSPRDLVELARLQVIKNPERVAPTTGIVLAGYGRKELFPTCIEHTSSGFIGDKIHVRAGRRLSVSRGGEAFILTFAMNEAMRAITVGVTDQLLQVIESLFVPAIDNMISELQGMGHLTSLPDNKRDYIFRHVRATTDAWIKNLQASRVPQTRQAVSTLSVEELAEMAETLIHLEALNERITGPSRSVSAPVDVAIITKHEGLRWVKRKQFFDASPTQSL